MNPLINRHRSFRLLWIGETISGLGSSVSTIVVPLIAVTMLHSSAFVVSAIAAAAWLPWLLFGLGAGPLADRVKRQRLMILCDVMSAILFASIPVAYAAGLLTAEQLVLVAFGTGCMNVLFTTAYGRYLIDVVTDPVDRGKANSLLQGSASAVRIAGVGVGGLLVELIGAPATLILDSISFLVSALCIILINSPNAIDDIGETVGRVSLRRQVIAGIDFSFRDPLMRPLVLFGGAANFALVGYQSLLILFLVRTVGLNAGNVGLLLALTSFGGAIGAFVGNPLARRFGSARALLLTKLGACPFALLIPLTSAGPREVLLVIGGLGVGIGIVAGNVISSGFFQTYTPTELFARTSATQNVFNYGTIPVGALVAGSLAVVFGVHAALWIMTALLPVTGIFLVDSPFLRMRSLPTERADWSHMRPEIGKYK
jgi:MFS family permease